VNGNQLGLILQLNSGLPVNLRSATDLNNDGVLAGRQRKFQLGFTFYF
jgi:hypothetical protein